MLVVSAELRNNFKTKSKQFEEAFHCLKISFKFYLKDSTLEDTLSNFSIGKTIILTIYREN